MSDVQIVLVVALCLAIGAVVIFVAVYLAQEWRWSRREREIRWGGPADRTLPDRLAQYQIEAEHPEESITTRERIIE